MKTFKSIFLIALTSIFMTSCLNDDVEFEPVIAEQALNIHAPVTTDYTVNPPTESGEFTKFSFATGTVVTGDNWDLAFRGTTIIVNGGVKVGLSDEPSRTGIGALSMFTGTFAEIRTAPNDSELNQDQADTLALPKGTWYSYNGQTHLISPVAGKVLVVRTHKGHYAKLEILSYYKDQDAAKDSRYYSFNYVYNPNLGDKNLE
ncbi:HmuY family protein [Mesoflavibacter zeaxanthinifaciens]|uniref:HmuY family protein n=1 Tax=Mesoflavibacter zeaxanthinifaciens TaxID=393060 RepID=UPI003A8DD02A